MLPRLHLVKGARFMPSERIQRRIDRLLDEAEQAVAAQDWALAKKDRIKA